MKTYANLGISIYGRVSTREKKDDLERQMAVLNAYCQTLGWSEVYALSDIGSGMNYRKKGLLRLLEMLHHFGS